MINTGANGGRAGKNIDHIFSILMLMFLRRSKKEKKNFFTMIKVQFDLVPSFHE